MSAGFKQLKVAANVFASDVTIDLIALIMAANATMPEVPKGEGALNLVIENIGSATCYINAANEADAITPFKVPAGDTLSAGPYRWDEANPVRLYGLTGASVLVSAEFRPGR